MVWRDPVTGRVTPRTCASVTGILVHYYIRCIGRHYILLHYILVHYIRCIGSTSTFYWNVFWWN